MVPRDPADAASTYAGRRRKLSQSNMAIKAGQGSDLLKACVKDINTITGWTWDPLPPSDEIVATSRQQVADAQRAATALASQLETKMNELASARSTIAALQVRQLTLRRRGLGTPLRALHPTGWNVRRRK
jgi:hypothetical protein